jgi:hypothetical protein
MRIHAFLLCLISMFSTGCATILDGGGKQNLSIRTTPTDATVSIFDYSHKDHKLISKNQTPAIVSLSTGSGFFAPAKYHVVIEKTGYKTHELDVKTGVRGWYFGNILFGGLIGMVIVDPMTGAMYKFTPETYDQQLASVQASNNSDTPILYVLLTDNLSPELRDHLLPLE